MKKTITKKPIFSNVEEEKQKITIDETNSSQEEKKLIDELKEVKDTKKETRGRKKKINVEDETKKQVFAEQTSQLGSLIIGIFVDRSFPEKPLSDIEKKLLDSNFEAVLFKYAEYLKNWKEEVALIAVLGFVFIPRIITKKKEEKILPLVEIKKEEEKNS